MRDERVSIEARGMLALLMTYADDWVFQRDHLMKVARIGRDKFQKVMRELIEAGYLQRVATRGDGGKVAGSTWLINDETDLSADNTGHEQAQRKAKKASNREPEFPALGSTDSLKNRPPVKPTAGFSGPLRRTRSKKTKIKENAGARETDFDRFMKAHPRPNNRERSRELFEAAKRSGVTVETIVKAAEQFREQSRGENWRYLQPSDDWLAKRRWQDFAEKSKPASASGASEGVASDLPTFWAEKISRGAYISASAISQKTAREMLERELVAPEALRRAGVNW